MFGKLVKHEFHATGRMIPLIFLVTVIVAAMMVVSVVLELGVLVNVTLVLLFFTVFAEVIVTLVLIIWRYYRSMCGNEAYLTHTLPVRPHLLLWSKLLVSFVWMALSYLLMLGMVAVIITLFASKNGTSVSEIMSSMRNLWEMLGLEGHEVTVITIFVAVFVTSILGGLTNAFFSISLGSTSKFHQLGIGGPILVYIILYIALQLINLLGMVFIPLALRIRETGGVPKFDFISYNMIGWFSDRVSGNAAQFGESIVGIGSFLILPVIIAVLLITTANITEKHTSVR
ncbi:MAG: hypothetical protein GX099_08230 [Clostridiaceae bacterium]|nr:hypothetical protein [Oscillospiraceae bacterium]NLO63394.1 hypothetical protein [Clostridiaceae bacterium]